ILLIRVVVTVVTAFHLWRNRSRSRLIFLEVANAIHLIEPIRFFTRNTVPLLLIVILNLLRFADDFVTIGRSDFRTFIFLSEHPVYAMRISRTKTSEVPSLFYKGGSNHAPHNTVSVFTDVPVRTVRNHYLQLLPVGLNFANAHRNFVHTLFNH